MSNRILQIALRITLIKEEFAESDILSAVKFLEARGTTSALLEYLAGGEVSRKPKKAGRKTKSIKEQRSKAVLALEYKDPEKFQILSEFDLLIRKGSILPELDDIKRLGERISKNFAPRSSRKEAVAKLMTLLASRSVEEVKDIFRTTTSPLGPKSNEYQELAKFLIKGKPSQLGNE